MKHKYLNATCTLLFFFSFNTVIPDTTPFMSVAKLTGNGLALIGNILLAKAVLQKQHRLGWDVHPTALSSTIQLVAITAGIRQGILNIAELCLADSHILDAILHSLNTDIIDMPNTAETSDSLYQNVTSETVDPDHNTHSTEIAPPQPAPSTPQTPATTSIYPQKNPPTTNTSIPPSPHVPPVKTITLKASPVPLLTIEQSQPSLLSTTTQPRQPSHTHAIATPETMLITQTPISQPTPEQTVPTNNPTPTSKTVVLKANLMRLKTATNCHDHPSQARLMHKIPPISQNN